MARKMSVCKKSAPPHSATTPVSEVAMSERRSLEPNRKERERERDRERERVGNHSTCLCGTLFCMMLRLVLGSHDAWRPSQAQEPSRPTCLRSVWKPEGSIVYHHFLERFQCFQEHSSFNVFKSVKSLMNSHVFRREVNVKVGAGT